MFQIVGLKMLLALSRKSVKETGEPFFQCPGSQESYEVIRSLNEYQQLSTICQEDKYHYTACYLPFFTPLVVNTTVMAVCGQYVCIFYGGYVMSGEFITLLTWCNKIEQCYNGGVDEMYCTEEEEMFQCRANDGVTGEISISSACDKKCDCTLCNDEWQCNGFKYHYWHNCNSTAIIVSYYICDSNTDCYHGEDESSCGNVTTCVREGFSHTYLHT